MSVVELRQVAEDAGEIIHVGFSKKMSSFSPAWKGKFGGFRPTWWEDDPNFNGKALCLHLVTDACYVPSTGAVIHANGNVMRSTVSQSRYIDPDLAKTAAAWALREEAPYLPRIAVSLPWGALHNYGHFILDGLSAAAELFRILGPEFSIVSPTLKPWQREHFRLAGIEPLELDQPIYRAGQVAFTSGMHSSLHAPNAHYQTLRSAQLSRCAGPPKPDAKIYVSRKGHKRPFLGEQTLEGRLERRGFAIISPEQHSVEEQIAIFRGAQTIVAPTGAALANILYSPPGVRVFELVPRDMCDGQGALGHKWVAYLTAMAGGTWLPYFCENTQASSAPTIGGEERVGYRSFDADIEDFLGFIDGNSAPV